jgi:hypothetical protein
MGTNDFAERKRKLGLKSATVNQTHQSEGDQTVADWVENPDKRAQGCHNAFEPF